MRPVVIDADLSLSAEAAPVGPTDCSGLYGLHARESDIKKGRTDIGEYSAAS